MYGTTEATDKLFAAMQKGELKAKDLLPKLAKEFENFAEAGLPSAVNSIGAEIERFKNSVFGFFTEVGQAGALSGVTQVIRVLADVIKGFTPIMAKLIGAFSFFARVLLTPLEILAKALKLITKIDNAIAFLIGRIAELVGMSKGVTKFAESILSLSTLVGFTIVAPIIAKMTSVFWKFLMLMPFVKRSTKGFRTYFKTLFEGNKTILKLSGGFRKLAASIGLANMSLMGFLAKIALPFLALAVVIEELVSVTDTSKRSLIKWALNVEGAIANFLRKPLALLAAGILFIDSLFAMFFGKDLRADRLREQVESLFDIEIDPKATIDEIWDKFWEAVWEKSAGEEGVLDRLLGLEEESIASKVVDLYKGWIKFVTTVPRHVINAIMSEDFFGTLVKPFEDAWDWISNLFTTKLPKAISTAASLMMAALEAKFIRPFQQKWNWLADKVPGMGKIEVSGEVGSRKEAGLPKRGPIQVEETKKPIPIPRKEAGLDNVFNKIGNPMDNRSITINLNQELTAAPGTSAEDFARYSQQHATQMFQNELSKTLANSPRTE